MPLTLEEKTELKDFLAHEAEDAMRKAAKIGRVPGDTEPKSAEGDRAFKSLGEQIKAVVRSETNHTVDPRLLAIEKAPAGMSEGAGAEGGFLLQTDLADGIIKRSYQMGQILSRCKKLPITGPSNGIKINVSGETSRASTRWGGFLGYWGSEAGTKSSSHPTFTQLELSLKKLYLMTYLTDELLEDVPALNVYCTEGATEELTFKLEDAIINGTGAGQPRGIMSAPCLVSVAAEGGQVATTIVAANIIKMWARMWGASRTNAVWLINQDIEPQLNSMSLAVGTGGIPVYMPAGGLSQAPFGTLMGRPVIPCEYCQTLGTTGDIILADLSQYLVIDKGGPTFASSIHVRFTTDETALRWVVRCDGQALWPTALTPHLGSNTLSPFVALASR